MNDNAFDRPQSRQHDFIRRNIWFFVAIIIGLTAFILGFIGYYQKGFGIFNSGYSTWRLFVLEWDWPNYPQGPLPYSIEWARWLAPIATAMSLIKAFQLAFKKQLQQVFFRYGKKPTIVCGIKNGGAVLAEELLRKGKKVAVIVKEQEAMNLNELEELGGYIVRGNFLDTDTLTTAGVRRCERVVIMEEDDVGNIGAAIKIIEANKNVALYVHLMDKSLNSVLLSSDAYHQNSTTVDLHFFNNYENAAKMLFRKYPYRVCNGAREPHLLLIGFGNAGEQILLQTIMNGHLRDNKRVKVTILDRMARQKEWYFEKKYPQITAHCKKEQRSFKQIDVETKDFLDYIGDNVKSFTQIIISFDDDKRSLSTALYVIEHARKELKEMDIRIAVRIGKTGNIISAVDNNNDMLERVFCFGWMEQVMSEDIIIDEKLDKMAMAFHDKYNEKKTPAQMIDWKDLGLFKKESSRAQSEHINIKLGILGLCARKADELPAKNMVEVSEDEFKKSIEPDRLTLAQMEHQRWNAFYYVNGWDTMTPKEIESKAVEKGYGNGRKVPKAEVIHQDEESKKHACIVDWDQLDDVAAQLSQYYDDTTFPFKEYDEGHISSLYKILTESGYNIYRQ